MVSITDTLDTIKRLLPPPSLATRKRLFLLYRWTGTMAVAITCTGRLGMGFKISPRAIGFSAGLQLPFSIILALRSRAASRTIRARRNNPGGLFPLASFARSIQHVTAAATGLGGVRPLRYRQTCVRSTPRF